MNKLLLKDIRCFRGDHAAPLAPITILVGENSTGKSTLLALTRVAWDIAFGIAEPNFNEEPFHFGAYDELAHYHGGRGKRAVSFSVGFSEQRRIMGSDPLSLEPISIIGTFSVSAGQPVLAGIKVESGPWRVEVQVKGDHLEFHISTPSGVFNLKGRPEYLPNLSARSLFYIMEAAGMRQLEVAGQGELFEGALPPRDEFDYLIRMLAVLRGPGLPSRRRDSGYGRPLAIAPIRSRPRRTYDLLREVRSPEGEHVPMLLARLSATNKSEWDKLAASLSMYGKASGLFDQVAVRRYAGSESAPFQLRVKLAGQKKEVNLVDVGYGVSQILPILVDALTERRPTFFLMQQPEVHLHPRAQAELGTFLATLVRQQNHRFLIETHSDHLVDRIRLEVKSRTLRPDMVSLLFLERSGSQSCIHEIGLDAAGNIVGPPAGYRRFFLEEELRIIS